MDTLRGRNAVVTRGHVVNVASLAGKSPIPFDAPYAANKAGLIAFTKALRIEFTGSPVRFSVVIPGFVDEGMYVRAQEHGFQVPGFLGLSKPEAVGAGVVEAILKDRVEVIVNPMPVKPAILLAEAIPGLLEQFYRRTGFLQRARRLAERRRQDE